MNINKLLAYQELDLQYNAVVKERNAVPEVKKALDARKLRDISAQVLIKNNNDSRTLYAQMDATLKEYAELQEEVNAILESVNGLTDNDDDDELDFLAHRLDTLAGELDKLQKDLSALTERVSSIRKEYEKTKENVRIAGAIMKQLNEKVTQISNEYKPKLDELNEKRKALRAELDPIDAETYDKINAAKKGNSPVIVPLDGNYCGGCLREMSQGQIQDVANKGYVICQECNRIVYKK